MPPGSPRPLVTPFTAPQRSAPAIPRVKRPEQGELARDLPQSRPEETLNTAMVLGIRKAIGDLKSRFDGFQQGLDKIQLATDSLAQRTVGLTKDELEACVRDQIISAIEALVAKVDNGHQELVPTLEAAIDRAVEPLGARLAEIETVCERGNSASESAEWRLQECIYLLKPLPATITFLGTIVHQLDQRIKHSHAMPLTAEYAMSRSISRDADFVRELSGVKDELRSMQEDRERENGRWREMLDLVRGIKDEQCRGQGTTWAERQRPRTTVPGRTNEEPHPAAVTILNGGLPMLQDLRPTIKTTSTNPDRSSDPTVVHATALLTPAKIGEATGAHVKIIPGDNDGNTMRDSMGSPDGHRSAKCDERPARVIAGSPATATAAQQPGEFHVDELCLGTPGRSTHHHDLDLENHAVYSRASETPVEPFEDLPACPHDISANALDVINRATEARDLVNVEEDTQSPKLNAVCDQAGGVLDGADETGAKATESYDRIRMTHTLKRKSGSSDAIQMQPKKRRMLLDPEESDEAEPATL